MKIAIVSFSMMESSMPLAKNLSIEENVDLYCLLPQGDQNAYIFNFENNELGMGFADPKIVQTILGEKISNYLFSTNLKVYIFPNRWFHKIFFLDLYYAFLLAKHLNKNKYDVIHIIHTSKRFWIFFYFFISKKKIIQTLHEVTSHEGKTSTVNKLILKLLIRYFTPIIFHSNVSKNRFIQFRKSVAPKFLNEDNLAMIRFSLFETYKLVTTEHIKKSNKITILNFGRITTNKGIDILIEAIKLLQEKLSTHLVIAGNGTPYFDFKGIKSYEFINKSISAEEMISLIQECEIVVLPYRSASQSGIPMTVFNFNKPIIASNISSFREVIENQKTGILVNNLTPQSLASAIEELLQNNDLKNRIISNIEKKYKEGEFSWSVIGEKTLSFYKKQLLIK